MSDVITSIEIKRDGCALSESQIFGIVGDYTNGSIPDYQMSAFLMAVFCKGMTDAETVALTRAMVQTGEILDLSSIGGPTLDKHSTGGVGDKVSLALVPIVAAAGVPIAKMSGRGLGHTGGTLDKLESIAGFRVELAAVQIIEQVQKIGACLCAQTARLVPADKKIYALRDVTGTVESIPLIAASIMSKKIAGGAEIILLDVKVGRGAFMKTVADARTLAATMRTIGKAFGRTVVTKLTSMDIPLGQAVGNLIEVKEVADLLRGCGVDRRLKELVLDLSDSALDLAGKDRTASSLIEDGSAWTKFCEIVEAQGGDAASIDRWESVEPVSKALSRGKGYIVDIDAESIGRIAMKLGAGRSQKEDRVDPLAGVRIEATVGTVVNEGTPLAALFGRPELISDELRLRVSDSFRIGCNMPNLPPTIIETADAVRNH